ncbi:transposable element Tcb2 transposase [Trichonephila clavipes]|nr:transposable element Tcb2 transposase [Trichonephila clavipes]
MEYGSFSCESRFNLGNQRHHDSPDIRSWHSSATCIASRGRAPRSHFLTEQCSPPHNKNSTGLPTPHFHPSFTCSITRFVTNRTYARSFRTTSWTSNEFGRMRGAFTATMERDITRHHAGLAYLNVSDCITHIRGSLKGRQIYRPISKRNRRTTAQQVANPFLAASGKQISRKTVARRLRGGGLYARRPVVCVPLTRQHRTARLQWCRERHNWTEQYWACVLFSDESRFSLSSDCRRQLIWRESGTAYRPENIQEKDRYPTCSIMVWAGIMINGRTRLHVVANGTMTGQRYIDEVLLPHVRLFRGAVGDKFVFMDDNATCHRTLAVQDCLDSEGIQRFVWPVRSPDLNPIENVWDALGRQVAGRNYPPTNKNTLIRALTEEWDKLPQSCWIMLCKVWYDVWNVAFTLHGGHIPY